MPKWLNSLWQNISSYTTGIIGAGVGSVIATTGVLIQQLAIIGVVIGIFLWMFKCTKVFRWSIVSYFIGLILEILGRGI